MAIATTPPPSSSSSTPVLNENASMKLGNSYLLPADALPSNAADHQQQKLPPSPNKGLKKKKNKYNNEPIPEGKLDYRDVLYTSFILSAHILCLFAPSTFSWDAFVVAYILYLLTGVFGVTMSYHRNLSHRSFKLPKYLEYMFAYFGLLAFQGDPIFWVSTHRHHHKVTDTERDPHSPIESFMFAHIYWLFDHKKRDRKGVDRKSVGDLTRQPFYIFLEKTVVFHGYLLIGLLYLLGDFPYVVWGMGVRTVWTLHITFLVNSVCHTWGSRRWKTGDLSRNNWFVAILSFGEGWHNNHHAFEYSARQGIDWWEIDMTYYAIKTLEYFGLATDVKVPSKLHMEKLAIKEDTKLSSSESREKFA